MSQRMIPSSIVERHPDAVEAEVSGTVVLMNIDNGTYCGLDGVALRIWKFIEHGAEIEFVSDVMCNEYDGEREIILRDLIIFFDQMFDQGLVRLRS